ncbi:MAG: FkbM family methyltransferase [Ignavibacteria bacterium]|nr:FkbM family methyltransferase [Ignavibacteria bacterium]
MEQLALGAETGTAELSVSDELNIFSTMSDRWKSTQGFGNYTEWNTTETVKMDTIDSLIDKYSLPKFCKIDVEGYEKNVLAGLHHKIPYISFEFTSIFFDDAEECLSLLSELGNTEYNVSFGESMQLNLNKWVTKEELIAYIRKNEGAWGDIYVHSK